MLKAKQKSWVPWHKWPHTRLLFCSRGQVTRRLPGGACTTSWGQQRGNRNRQKWACECSQADEQLQGSHLVFTRESEGRGVDWGGGEGSQRGATVSGSAVSRLRWDLGGRRELSWRVVSTQQSPRSEADHRRRHQDVSAALGGQGGASLSLCCGSRPPRLQPARLCARAGRSGSLAFACAVSFSLPSVNYGCQLPAFWAKVRLASPNANAMSLKLR